MPQYNDDKRDVVKAQFFAWCERIGYTDPEEGVRIVIVDGLPVQALRPLQSVRFDRDLTKGAPNATMD